MRLITKSETKLVYKQIPLLLYFAAAVLSLPFLLFGLINTIKQTGVEGSTFTLIIGVLLGWFMFNYVASFEIITIDRTSQLFTRTERGLFRVERVSVPIAEIDSLLIEKQRAARGSVRTSVFLKGNNRQVLVNNPSIVYIDHHRTAVMISEFLALPIQTR